AVGGKKEIMDQLAPGGKVYEASTFAGNPISVAAAIASIKTMSSLRNRLYTKMARQCATLVKSIEDTASRLHIPHQVNSIESMFQIFFTDVPVLNYATSKKADGKKFHKMFHYLLKKGVFVAPSQFETGFFSYAHTESDLAKTISAYDYALEQIRQ
ncbi:MAG: aminotransferase class III-fold pyridoxal phosphate-dependent enzyme, partial [Candidatus Nitrosotenuis sp.]